MLKGKFNLMCILLLLTLGAACGATTPTPEQLQQVKVLRSELEQVQTELKTAERKDAELAGGLVKALVQARLEILKTTKALIEQRIQALESGTKITVEVPGTAPDPTLAEEIKAEMETQEIELKKAQEEASQYSGGLVAAMKSATVATHEQTLAMLRQRYLAAKYGLPTIPTSGSQASGTSKSSAVRTQEATPTSSGESPAASEPAQKIFAVRLLKKRFAEQDYQDFIFFDIQFTASGLERPSRAIKGVLNLADLFGEPHMQINWTIEQPISPGSVIVENDTGFKFNQFLDAHQWVRSTDLENMTATFTARSILYKDGTRQDF